MHSTRFHAILFLVLLGSSQTHGGESVANPADEIKRTKPDVVVTRPCSSTRNLRRYKSL